MRKFGLGLFVVSMITLLCVLPARSEVFSQFSQERANAIERAQYSYLKYLDLLPLDGKYSRETDTRVTSRLAELPGRRSEGRCIVTRQRFAPTPTWDGRVPAFIVDPMIWHFDPDSTFHHVSFEWLQRTLTKPLGKVNTQNDPTARRSFAEFSIDPKGNLPVLIRGFGDFEGAASFWLK